MRKSRIKTPASNPGGVLGARSGAHDARRAELKSLLLYRSQLRHWSPLPGPAGLSARGLGTRHTWPRARSGQAGTPSCAKWQIPGAQSRLLSPLHTPDTLPIESSSPAVSHPTSETPGHFIKGVSHGGPLPSFKLTHRLVGTQTTCKVVLHNFSFPRFIAFNNIFLPIK